MRAIQSSLAMIALLSLANCGGKDKDGAAPVDTNAAAAQPTSASDLDPCSLLAVDEASRIVGDKLTGAQRDGNRCKYPTDDMDALDLVAQSSGAADLIAIDRKTADIGNKLGDAAANSGSAAGKDAGGLMASDGKSAGLGDESFFGMGGTLSVRRGDAYLAITPPSMHSRISHPGSPLMAEGERNRIATEAAKAALARLP